MASKLPEMKEEEIDNNFFGYPQKLRKDGRSHIITVKKEIVFGCGVSTHLPVFCQLVRYKGRPALMTFLDNRNFVGEKIKE